MGIFSDRGLVILTGRSLVILVDAIGGPSLLAVAGAEPGHIYGSGPGHTSRSLVILMDAVGGPSLVAVAGAEPGHIYGPREWRCSWARGV